MGNIRDSYKISQTDVEKSYIKQMGLKMNPEYEKWADDTAINLIEYFTTKYNGVLIEIPKLREKSPKSLLGKIKNLEIERLSKLYAVEGISEEDKKELYSLLKERVEEIDEIDENNEKDILKTINKLMNGEKLSVEKFESKLMKEGLSNSSKTALLRIYTSNLERNNDFKQIKKLGRKYGKAKASKTGSPEDDLIRYNSITDLRTNKQKLNRLRDSNQFLKANDLRGMKLVVVDIEDDFETDNPKIRQLLKQRQEDNNKNRTKFNHLITVELGKEFYKDIEQNDELQRELSLSVIQGSSKHKKKKNGYEAEHIKFYNTEEPEFTLEMQFKSEYVENISRGEGTASHQNRPGKSRILPEADNDKELLDKLNFTVPKYTTFRIENDHIIMEKQSMLRNTISYYQKQIQPGSAEYEKIFKLYDYDDSCEKIV